MAHLYEHKAVLPFPCQSLARWAILGHIQALCTCAATFFICFDRLMAEILSTSLTCAFQRAFIESIHSSCSVFPHSPALLSAHLVSGGAFVDVIQFPIVHSALQE